MKGPLTPVDPEVYKIIRGIDRVDSQRLFPRVEVSITRGHRFKVRGGKFKGDVWGKFFMQRVVGAWNALPEEVVEAGTLATFKRHLDGERIEGYSPSKGRRFFFSLVRAS